MKNNIPKKYKISISVFNGMSVSLMAFIDQNINFDKLYICEIDKFVNNASNLLFPNTYQLGDITKWRTWDIKWKDVDFFIGGPPCQGFSFAGKMAGTKARLDGVDFIVNTRLKYLSAKKKGAYFYSQSYLFWEYILCLDNIKKYNPNVKFLLENVSMKKEMLDMITGAIGTDPVCINSHIFSAQNRKRYYWTNFNVEIPKENDNKFIVLKDIIDNTGIIKRDHVLLDNKKYFLRPCKLRKILRGNSHCHNIATATDIKGNQSILRVYDINYKCPTLTTMTGGNRQPKIYMGIFKNIHMYRKLTPRECFRLQSIPENFIDILISSGISNSQLYKMCGNSFNMLTISYILYYFKMI